MDKKKIRHFVRNILLEHFLKEESESKNIPMEIYVDKSNKDDVWNIKKVLNSNGFDMYIVGGAVRDAIKNSLKIAKNPMDTTLEMPKDFDLATDAEPLTIKKLFEKQPFISNILNIGESFAIQFLVTKSGNQYELATFRSDEGGGRRPDSVKFEKTPQRDAERRDLTINALFYNITEKTDSGFLGEVVDYVGGFEDVKNNVVNTVGNPEDRFSEDPLRKLRAIRFAARMGAKIPDNVINAIKKDNTSLTDPTGNTVSDERIRDEFLKGIKSAKSTKNFLSLLKELGFMKHVFKDLEVKDNDFIEEKNPIVLIANLLKQNEIKKIENTLKEKRYGLDEINAIKLLVSLLYLNEDTISVINKFYNQKIKDKNILSKDDIFKFAKLNHIDIEKTKNLLRLSTEFIQPTEILQSLGYQNKELGNAIKKLEQEFYKNPNKVKGVLDNKDLDEIKKLLFIKKGD